MAEEDRVAGIETRMERMQGDVTGMQRDIAHVQSDITHMQGDITEIKATLAQLVPMIIRIDQKLSEMPTQAEVAELRGRVEEQSKFLQLALAGRQKRPAAE